MPYIYIFFTYIFPCAVIYWVDVIFTHLLLELWLFLSINLYLPVYMQSSENWDYWSRVGVMLVLHTYCREPSQCCTHFRSPGSKQGMFLTVPSASKGAITTFSSCLSLICEDYNSICTCCGFYWIPYPVSFEVCFS